jgi:hypothetical protein
MSVEGLLAEVRPLICRGMKQSAVSHVTTRLGLSLSGSDPRYIEVERQKRTFYAQSQGTSINKSESLLGTYIRNISQL